MGGGAILPAERVEVLDRKDRGMLLLLLAALI